MRWSTERASSPEVRMLLWEGYRRHTGPEFAWCVCKLPATAPPVTSAAGGPGPACHRPRPDILDTRTLPTPPPLIGR